MSATIIKGDDDDDDSDDGELFSFQRGLLR